MDGLEVGAGDRAKRRRGAAGRVRIGRFAVERAHRGEAGHLARIAHRDGDRVDRDRPLPVELLLGKGRVAGDVGDDRERRVGIGGADGEAEPCALPAGVASERGAERLDRGVDLGGRARRRALAHHRGGQRRGAGAPVRIRSRAAARDQRGADQGKRPVGHGDHGEAVGEPLHVGRRHRRHDLGRGRRRSDPLRLARRLDDPDIGRRGERRGLRRRRRFRSCPRSRRSGSPRAGSGRRRSPPREASGARPAGCRPE